MKLWIVIEHEPADPWIPVCTLGIFLSDVEADAAVAIRAAELHQLGRKDVDLIVDSWCQPNTDTVRQAISR